jgi:uridine kinase
MRDTKERGRTIDSINKQYSESVRPMFDQYIAPSKKYADIVINSTKSEKDLIAPIKNEIDKNLN